MNKLKLLFLSIAIVITNICIAGTPPIGYRYTTKAGNPNDASVWDGGTKPAAGADVYIQHNLNNGNNISWIFNDVIIADRADYFGDDGGMTANNLTVELGGKFHFYGANNTFNGNVIINGEFYDQNGTGTNLFNGPVTVQDSGKFTPQNNTTIVGKFINQGIFDNVNNSGGMTFKDTVINQGWLKCEKDGFMRVEKLFWNQGKFTTTGNNNFTGFALRLLDDIQNDSTFGTLVRIEFMGDKTQYIKGTGITLSDVLVKGTATTVINTGDVSLKYQFNTDVNKGTFTQTKSGKIKLLGNVDFYNTIPVLDTAGTVEYAASNMGIKIYPYYNLSVTGTGETKLPDSSIVVNNDLYVALGSNLFQKTTAPTKSLIVKGKITSDGSINLNENNTGGYGKLEVLGTEISGIGKIEVMNLVINNAAVTNCNANYIKIRNGFNNLGGGFNATAGKVEMSNGAMNVIAGNGNDVTFNKLTAILNSELQTNIVVQDTFYAKTGKDQVFNLNGYNLTLNGLPQYELNGSNTYANISGDANSSVYINGGSALGNEKLYFIMKTNTSLKNFVCNLKNATDTLVIRNPMTISDTLVLGNGNIDNITGTTTLSNNAEVIKYKGVIFGSLAIGTGNMVNLTYKDAATAGNEIPGTGKLKNLTVDADASDVVTLKSAAVNGDFVIKSGVVSVTPTNYITLNGNKQVTVKLETASFPYNLNLPLTVGGNNTVVNTSIVSATSAADATMTVEYNPTKNSAISGTALNFITAYVKTTTQNVSAINYNIDFTYNNDQITGNEALYEPQFYNNATWAQIGAIDVANNSLAFTGVTEAGEFTTYKEGPTSVQQIAESKTTMFPNPAKNSCAIANFNGGTIQIINLNGTVVTTINSTDSQVELPVSTLPSGVYLVKIQSNNQTSTERLIKE